MRRRNKKKRAKPGTKTRMVQGAQVRHREIGLAPFMNAKAFLRGLEDARDGVPFDYRFCDAHLRFAVQYENGRQFGVVTKTWAMALLRGGRQWLQRAKVRFLEAIRCGEVCR